jgi:hypothetical protein
MWTFVCCVRSCASCAVVSAETNSEHELEVIITPEHCCLMIWQTFYGVFVCLQPTVHFPPVPPTQRRGNKSLIMFVCPFEGSRTFCSAPSCGDAWDVFGHRTANVFYRFLCWLIVRPRELNESSSSEETFQFNSIDGEAFATFHLIKVSWTTPRVQATTERCPIRRINV